MTAMNFTQFLHMLHARRKIVLRTLMVTVLATLALSLILPKTYKATTTLVLNYKGADPVTGVTVPAYQMAGYMSTQVDILSSRNVALKVVDDLKLVDDPQIRKRYESASKDGNLLRDQIAEDLMKKLSVVPARDSSVIQVSFKASDPQFAARVANAFTAAYQKANIQLKVEPARNVSSYFNEQVKLSRDRLEAAQKKFSKYQQDHGIVNADSRLDLESARLNELSTQLVATQGQLAEAMSRKNQSQGQGAADSPDIAANPLIQNLKSELARAQAQFAYTAERFQSAHPQYQAHKAEVDRRRADLNREIRNTADSVSSNAAILQKREAQTRAALEAQRTKVMELNRARDELSVLGKEMESAQRAYESIAQKFSAANLEGQANQSDIAVLTPAAVPTIASSPRVPINLLVAVFLGLLLGMGLGFLAEMLDRRVRSDIDFGSMGDVPLLGTIEWGGPRSPWYALRKPEQPRRLALS